MVFLTPTFFIHGKSSATTTLKWKSSMIDTTSFIRFHQETLIYQVPWAVNIFKFMNIYEHFTIFNPKPVIPFPPKSGRLAVDSADPSPQKLLGVAKGAAASGRTSFRRKIWRWRVEVLLDAKWFLYLAEYGSWQPEILQTHQLKVLVVEIPMILRRIYFAFVCTIPGGVLGRIFSINSIIISWHVSPIQAKNPWNVWRASSFCLGWVGGGIPMFNCCNLLEDIFWQTAHTFLAIILYWYQ